MKFKGSICESGGKKLVSGRFVNEDSLEIFATKHNNREYNFVILMDGATGLGKPYQIEGDLTSAEWYVKYITGVMKEELLYNPDENLEDVVEKGIQKVIEKIEEYEKSSGSRLEEYEKPSAGLALLRTNGEKTEIYLIGDTQTVIGYKDGNVKLADNPNQKALQKLDNSVINRMVELAKERKCNVLDTRTDEEIEKMLQVNRSKKNSNEKDGYWVCGTTNGTAKHGVVCELNNSEIEAIILATDGFDYSVLELEEKQAYIFVKEQGTRVVTDLIRERQNEDELCNKYPRFKKGDDLTVIYCEY